MLPKIRHITFDFHMNQSPQSLWSVFQSLINICCHILHIRFLGNLVLTERKERNWPEKEPRHQSFASLATLTTAQVDPLTSTNYFWSSGLYIMFVILLHHGIISQEHRGHQSSGARAPELWCPHIFFQSFLDGVLTFMLAVFR